MGKTARAAGFLWFPVVRAFQTKQMPEKISRLNCRKKNCARSAIEIGVNAENMPVIRVKNRHDGETHITEFSVEEINKRVSEIVGEVV